MLTELLVALAIMALVAVAGYAQYRATEGARVKGAAEQVATLLRRVGQAAWTERTPYRVVFTPGGGAVRVERWSGGAWVEARGAIVPDWLVVSGLIPAGASVAWTTFPGDAYLAHPYTLGGTGQVGVSTTAGQVALRGPGGAQLVVETSAAGEVTVRW
jgi:Tfp pilus assembly protein FimT